MLAIIGLVLIVVGGIWVLLEAFRVGILWGLACLFIPIVPIVFVIVHWEKANRPVAIYVLGWILFFVGGGGHGRGRISDLPRAPRAVAAQTLHAA